MGERSVPHGSTVFDGLGSPGFVDAHAHSDLVPGMDGPQLDAPAEPDQRAESGPRFAAMLELRLTP